MIILFKSLRVWEKEFEKNNKILHEFFLIIILCIAAFTYTEARRILKKRRN